MGDRPRAVVIGGGITGLVAAYDLHRAGWSVTVHEASNRWGGKIHSSPVGDRLVDAGPDSMLARVDAGRDLCRELGLDDDLDHPVAAIPALVHHNGALHRLPSGTILGVPTDLDALADLISPRGIEAARADLTQPWPGVGSSAPPSSSSASPFGPDPSVGAVCRARLGDEITDLLIDPLLGGINASDIDHLSLRSAAPQLLEALETEGSLIRGMASRRPAAGATFGAGRPAPVFYGLSGGLARMIDGLVAALDGAHLRLGSPITDLADHLARERADGRPEPDAVIVATPTFATAELLARSHPEVASALSGVDYASVAQVTLEFPTEAVDEVLDTSGILFPRSGGTVLTACTWFSSKWAHYRRPGHILLRLTSGRFNDERIAGLDDEALVATLLDEVRPAIGLHGKPTAVRVHRWTRSLPQYAPGHAERVAAARRAVADGPGRVLLVGAAYDGIGIPACITAGRAAAAELVEDRHR